MKNTTTSCLGYVGDYATQLSEDYNKPLFPDPLLNDRYNGSYPRLFFFATQMFLNLMKEIIPFVIAKWLRMVRIRKYNIRLTSSGHLVICFGARWAPTKWDCNPL